MDRINGYIDLNKILNDKGVDTTSFDNAELSGGIEEAWENVYTFDYDNSKYYFKYSEIASPYNELVGDFLLDDFNIPHVSYDLATFCGKKGVISKDFTKDGVEYVSGLEILENYTPTRGAQIRIFNNLEDIWNALDLYFKDKENREEIVAKVMDQLVDLFMFDILVSNNDRNVSNWGLEIDGDSVNLAVVYDNERIGLNYRNHPILDMVVSMDEEDGLYDNLSYFLNISDSSYKDRLKNKMWIISEENILNVFKRIEDRTGSMMPEELKENYLDFFNRHRNKINNVVENSNMRNI